MSWSEQVLEMSNLSYQSAEKIAEEHGLKDEFRQAFKSKTICSHDLLEWLGY